MRNISLALKAKIAIDILKSDPNVRETYYDPQVNCEKQLGFWTHDKSDAVGEWIGLHTETRQKLLALGFDYDFNSCPGYEDEGVVHLTREES